MSAKNRIMMISTHGYVGAVPELGKPDTGGQVVYVLELSKCFGRMGYQVDILTRQFEDQPREERVARRVRVLRFPCGGKDFIPKETLCEHIPEWVTTALRMIQGKRLRYEFINSHYWDAGLAGQALASALQIRHMHTPHSIGSWKRDNMDEPPDVLERKYNFRQRIREEAVIYDECDALIATTPQQRDILCDPEGEYEVPREKVFVVPPGYDDNRFFPVSGASRLALKKEHQFEGPIVLALGRMAHNKGYDLLIQAMPVVFERIKGARLLLAIGSTEPSPREREQIEELKQLAERLGVAGRIIYRDYIPDDELADYYRMADVFALSSRYEPFGMTAVEAMACETPAVITTEGGLWEQIIWGLDGIYANPFDPQAFGHAICAVLQHPKLATQLAKFGSQKARARFTWTGVAQRILARSQSLPARVNVPEEHEQALGREERAEHLEEAPL
ncbi:MAG: glycosyltransferase [Phycisphaerales bacterium]|nr:MAG: glycosyltransferase [Phycisphaerales bacterium]